MSDYPKLKVSELKELLKERDLPLSGTKSELVARLAADDESKGTDAAPSGISAETSEPSETVTEPTTEAEGTEQAAESGTGPATDAEADSAVTDTPGEPEKPGEPELSQAEAQQLVIEELEQRLKRHKRFGTDATDTELRLKRIKQFGLSDINEAKKLSSFKEDSRKRRFKSRNKKVTAA